MLTVKTIDERGNDKVFAVDAVTTTRDYDVGDSPDRLNFVGKGGFVIDVASGQLRFGHDRSINPRYQVFVMNDNGATIADYVMSRAQHDEPEGGAAACPA